MNGTQTPGSLNSEDESAPFPNNPGVLVVDDDEQIRTLLQFALEPRGFAVWLAADGFDAVDQYRCHRTGIGVVLLDVQMPGRDGPSTLAAIRRHSSDVPVCFMTGDAGRYTRDELVECGATRVFDKPLRVAELAHCLRAILSTAARRGGRR